MKGGNLIKYESTEQSKNEVCNKIKGERNIYKNQIRIQENKAWPKTPYYQIFNENNISQKF